MGDEDSIATRAADNLRLLQREITEPRARPVGPSGRTRNPFPAGPIPAGLLDHIRAAHEEAVRHTHEVAPDAGPVPAQQAEVYRWMDESTRDLDAEKRRATEAIMYRQQLEHAIKAGRHEVIRPIPCPACGCWSLFWDKDRGLARCGVDDCLTAGRPSVWTLRQLAGRAVEESPKRAAT